MSRFGFCGPTYSSQSVNADCQRAVNVYLEANESGQGNSPFTLYASPGLRVFATLQDSPMRGEFFMNGRMFAVGGARFFEILQNGTVINVGAVANDGLPVSITANQGGQVLIASGGTLYIFNLNTNVMSQPAGAPGNISIVGFTDGYFVALTRNSNQFQLSNSLDGTTWTGINTAKVSVFPDNLITMIVDHKEIALFGDKQANPYFDSANTFPYDPVPGGFVEQGAAATYCISKMDNSVFWMGADERGQGIAWRNNGYTPQRISNHSVEYIWSRYPRISDAISYSFQDQGHTFWHIYFPSGLNDSGLPLGASWRYDAATQMWHEVAFWDATNGRYTAHRSMCHAFAWGMHLVGDWNSGNIYQMDVGIRDDFGNAIRWMRTSPHVAAEQQRIKHPRLTLHMETGVSQDPMLVGPDSTPSAYPSNIVLQDPNGVLWDVSIGDSSNIIANPVASGIPQTFILQDSGMIPTTCWQFGITIAGNLTTTPVAYSPLPPQIFPMRSIPGNHLTGLLVTAQGNIQTNVPPLGREPQICMQFSDDGAHTWSNEHWRGMGMPGKYKTRIIWNRLGMPRDRVYKIFGTDPVKIAIVDAYVGPPYQERLVHQLRKSA